MNHERDPSSVVDLTMSEFWRDKIRLFYLTGAEGESQDIDGIFTDDCDDGEDAPDDCPRTLTADELRAMQVDQRLVAFWTYFSINQSDLEAPKRQIFEVPTTEMSLYGTLANSTVADYDPSHKWVSSLLIRVNDAALICQRLAVHYPETWVKTDIVAEVSRFLCMELEKKGRRATKAECHNMAKVAFPELKDVQWKKVWEKLRDNPSAKRFLYQRGEHGKKQHTKLR